MCRNIHTLHNYEPHATQHLLDSLVAHGPAKDRAEEAAKAKARAAIRFGTA